MFFLEEKQYFFADLPPNSAFPNLTLDARSSVIYNLYGKLGVRRSCSHPLTTAHLIAGDMAQPPWFSIFGFI